MDGGAKPRINEPINARYMKTLNDILTKAIGGLYSY